MGRARRQSGFTLVELVVALVLTSILMVGLLPFFARPLEAMLAGSQSAAATEHAERALARMRAELPTALPNSVRIACGGRCLEFIPVIVQADYRAEAPGDTLSFTAADDRFDVLLPLAAAPAAGLGIVINNLDASPAGSTSAYSADAAGNRGTVAAGSTAARIRIDSKQFPATSPRQRFYVVGTPVSYLCAPTANGGTLRRLAGYAIQPNQPTDTSLGALLASAVVDCTFALHDARLVSTRLVAGDGAIDPVALFDAFRLANEP